MLRALAIFTLFALFVGGCAAEAPAPARAHLLAGPMQRPSPPRGHNHEPRPGPAPGPSLQLAVDDVLGKPVRLGPPGQARVAVVFVMSRESREESSALGRAVDEALLDQPLEQVSIVDVHRYGGALRGMATWQMRQSARQALERRKQRREQHHVDASAEAVGRWHLVPDFDGALLKRLSVTDDLMHPLAFVVTPDGALHGPYRDAAQVVEAVRRVGSSSNGRKSVAAPAPNRRTASR